MRGWRSKRIIPLLLLCIVLVFIPVLNAAASDPNNGSSAVYDGIKTNRSDTYITKSVTYQGLTTTVKGLTEKNYGQILKMFSRNIPASLKSGIPYKLTDQSFIDAEKYSIEPAKDYDQGYDAMLCWASVASNMLWISGYAREAVSPLTNAAFNNEDEVFDYFRKCFADFTGEPDGAAEYFLNGTYKYSGTKNVSQLRNDAVKGGLLKHMYTKADFKNADNEVGSRVLGLLDNLTDVSASVFVEYRSVKTNLTAGGHVLTVMGTVKDDHETDYRKKYKGLILADSDNTPVTDLSTSPDPPEEKARKASLAPNVYTFYPLSFEKKGDTERWIIKNYSDDSSYYAAVRSVFTIKDRLPDEEKNPEGSDDGGNQTENVEDRDQDRQSETDKEKLKAPASVKTEVRKNKVTVSWKKIRNTEKNRKLIERIKGIQIQYATDPVFRENRKTKTVGKGKTSAVLKLKKKTTYYVRVRYIGKGEVSKWSKTRKVKI